jgi:hypothetical protein
VSVALILYLLPFLGAELTSISATEYAFVVIVHAFLLSAFGLLAVRLGAREMPDA